MIHRIGSPPALATNVARPSTPRTASPCERGRSFGDALREARGEAVRTPLGGGEAREHLHDAWVKVTGREPPRGAVELLWAQWAHETGRGSRMMAFNFGGLKGCSPSGATASYATREGFGPSERRLVDRFRAYATPAEGAEDYVRTLATRYRDAFDAASRADAAGFVHALRHAGYFTDREQDYARSVAALAREAASLDVAPTPSTAAPPVQLRDPGPAAFGVIEALAHATARRGSSSADE